MATHDDYDPGAEQERTRLTEIKSAVLRGLTENFERRSGELVRGRRLDELDSWLHAHGFGPFEEQKLRTLGFKIVKARAPDFRISTMLDEQGKVIGVYPDRRRFNVKVVVTA